MTYTYLLMLALAGLMALALAMALSMARDNWVPPLPSHWRAFWAIAAGIFLLVEALAFFGLGWIPMAVFGVVICVLVIGGFIAALLLPRN